MKIKTPEEAGTKMLTKSVSALWRNIQLASTAAVPTAVLCASQTPGQFCSNRKRAVLDMTPLQWSKQSWEKQWLTCLPGVSSESLHLAYAVRSRWRCARRGRKGMVLLISAQGGTEMWPWSTDDTMFKMVESSRYKVFTGLPKEKKPKMWEMMCFIYNSISDLYTRNSDDKIAMEMSPATGSVTKNQKLTCLLFYFINAKVYHTIL